MEGFVALMLDDLFGIFICCVEMVCFGMFYFTEPGVSDYEIHKTGGFGVNCGFLFLKNPSLRHNPWSFAKVSIIMIH